MTGVRRPITITCVAVTATLALAACGTSRPQQAADAGTRITVSVGECGAGWTSPTAGQQHFVLADTDTRAGEVLLTDARSGAVYADVEPIGPGTTTDLTIDLGSGSYAFSCAMEDESTVVGPTVTIAGTAQGSAVAVAAVTQGDLIAATKAYQAYVSGRIPTLVSLTARLGKDIAAGDLATARRDWLPAHLQYEQLGAAYDAFGDLDAAINGLPNGLPKGVDDPGWQGFHRLEYGLWNGQSAAALKPHATALLTSVHALGAEFATAQIDPLDISIRAHEIAENAVQFELTGETDFGSHSNLATVRANLDGTTTVLGIIRSLLTTRYAQLPALDTELARAKIDLDAVNQHGEWPALDTLSRSQREHIDADLSELTEQLAPIASILEPRRPS